MLICWVSALCLNVLQWHTTTWVYERETLVYEAVPASVFILSYPWCEDRLIIVPRQELQSPQTHHCSTQRSGEQHHICVKHLFCSSSVASACFRKLLNITVKYYYAKLEHSGELGCTSSNKSGASPFTFFMMLLRKNYLLLIYSLYLINYKLLLITLSQLFHRDNLGLGGCLMSLTSWFYPVPNVVFLSCVCDPLGFSSLHWTCTTVMGPCWQLISSVFSWRGSATPHCRPTWSLSASSPASDVTCGTKPTSVSCRVRTTLLPWKHHWIHTWWEWGEN